MHSQQRYFSIYAAKKNRRNGGRKGERGKKRKEGEKEKKNEIEEGREEGRKKNELRVAKQIFKTAVSCHIPRLGSIF